MQLFAFFFNVIPDEITYVYVINNNIVYGMEGA